MKIFIDTAEIEQIKNINRCFLLDGVTTNPSLVADSGVKHHELIQSICQEVSGVVSAEVISTKAEDMYKESKELAALHSRVVIKLPLTIDGLMTTKKLSEEKIKTNVTLCFSAVQALMAAKAGATMVSIFVGRLDDIGVEGMKVVEQTKKAFVEYGLQTQVLFASVRSVAHILQAMEARADIITIPPVLFSKAVKHPLTDIGLDQFLESARRSSSYTK